MYIHVYVRHPAAPAFRAAAVPRPILAAKIIPTLRFVDSAFLLV